jgi:hypothetical protein
MDEVKIGWGQTVESAQTSINLWEGCKSIRMLMKIEMKWTGYIVNKEQ